MAKPIKKSSSKDKRGRTADALPNDKITSCKPSDGVMKWEDAIKGRVPVVCEDGCTRYRKIEDVY